MLQSFSKRASYRRFGVLFGVRGSLAGVSGLSVKVWGSEGVMEMVASDDDGLGGLFGQHSAVPAVVQYPPLMAPRSRN